MEGTVYFYFIFVFTFKDDSPMGTKGKKRRKKEKGLLYAAPKR